MKKKTYRVHWRWLDGTVSESIAFTRKRAAEACLRRFAEVALIDTLSLRITATDWPITR